MNSEKKFPVVPKELLDELEERFPNKIPISHYVSTDDFRDLQGQQRVIALLRHQFDLQNKTVIGEQ